MIFSVIGDRNRIKCLQCVLLLFLRLNSFHWIGITNSKQHEKKVTSKIGIVRDKIDGYKWIARGVHCAVPRIFIPMGCTSNSMQFCVWSKKD